MILSPLYLAASFLLTPAIVTCFLSGSRLNCVLPSLCKLARWWHCGWGYAVYYPSLRLFLVAKVSAAIYLSQPVTMLRAWMLFSEPLTFAMFAGLAVTLVGVWMTSPG